MIEIVRWPSEIGLKQALENANYRLATEYFSLNISLVLLALLFGFAFLELILRSCRHKAAATMPLREVVLLGVSLGFAVMIAELFILSLFGWLTSNYVSLALAVSGVLSVTILLLPGRLLPRIFMPLESVPQCFLTVIVVLLLAVYQYSAAAAPSVGDSTSYHAPYADFFVRHHGLAVDYHLIYPFQTFNINLLFSLGLLLKHDLSYLQTIHALFATFTMYGLYVGCLRFGRRAWLAILLPFIFCQIYTVRFGRFAALVDLGSMFFVFAAVYTLLLWYETRARWQLLISAILFGIAMGSKYIMCVFAAPIALFIVVVARREAFRVLLWYGGCAALWGLWWYVRNMVLTGNPVHPFAPSIFGYYLWNEADMLSQMDNLHNSFVPPSLTGFLAAPYFAVGSKVLMQQHVFHVLLALYIATPLFLLASGAARYLPLFCFCYLLFWVMGSPDPRYFISVVPLALLFVVSVFSGVLDRVLQYVGVGSDRYVAARKTGSLLCCVATLLYAFFYVQQQFVHVLYQAVDPAEARLDLLKNVPEYELIEKANETFGEHGRMFEFTFRNVRWFFKGTMLGTQFGEHGYFRVLAQVENDNAPGYSPEKLDALLRSRYQADGFMIPNPPYFNYDQKAFDQYFDLVYRNVTGSIYRLKPAHITPSNTGSH